MSLTYLVKKLRGINMDPGHIQIVEYFTGLGKDSQAPWKTFIYVSWLYLR